MPCSLKWQHIQRSYLNENLATLLGHGVDPFSTSYLNVARVGNSISINLGFKVPRPIVWVLKLFGLSPGEIKLWYDAELGFMTEARAYDSAPPVYHYITTAEAAAIMKGELTHELEQVLMTPDPYLGE